MFIERYTWICEEIIKNTIKNREYFVRILPSRQIHAWYHDRNSADYKTFKNFCSAAVIYSADEKGNHYHALAHAPQANCVSFTYHGIQVDTPLVEKYISENTRIRKFALSYVETEKLIRGKIAEMKNAIKQFQPTLDGKEK